MHTCTVDLHEAGLQDGCPACAEHAEKPIHDLDEAMLRHLTELAVDRDRLMVGRSEAELVASAKILTLLEQIGRLSEVAGDVVAAYLRDRWRLAATIAPRDYAAMRERLGL